MSWKCSTKPQDYFYKSMNLPTAFTISIDNTNQNHSPQLDHWAHNYIFNNIHNVTLRNNDLSTIKTNQRHSPQLDRWVHSCCVHNIALMKPSTCQQYQLSKPIKIVYPCWIVGPAVVISTSQCSRTVCIHLTITFSRRAWIVRAEI